jgi:hypothetical protein
MRMRHLTVAYCNLHKGVSFAEKTSGKFMREPLAFGPVQHPSAEYPPITVFTEKFKLRPFGLFPGQRVSELVMAEVFGDGTPRTKDSKSCQRPAPGHMAHPVHRPLAVHPALG